VPVSGGVDILPATTRACEFRRLYIHEAVVKVCAEDIKPRTVYDRYSS